MEVLIFQIFSIYLTEGPLKGSEIRIEIKIDTYLLENVHS